MNCKCFRAIPINLIIDYEANQEQNFNTNFAIDQLQELINEYILIRIRLKCLQSCNTLLNHNE